MKQPLNRREFISHSLLISAALSSPPSLAVEESGERGNLALSPVSCLQTKLLDSFFGKKQQLVSRTTLRHLVDVIVNETGCLRNFENAARRSVGLYEAGVSADSDLYKSLEAIAYSLSYCPDSQLQQTADDWIDKIAAAQLPDGYLNTHVILTDINRRWTQPSEEDYCAGHLIEAAVAYYQTTGKRQLLDVAIRFADHIDSTLRVPGRNWVSGHEEIELALVKLYRVTGNGKYLSLAQWYLDQRGQGKGSNVVAEVLQEDTKSNNQNDIPVRQQRVITGHAVCAMYLYSAVADVAAITRDPDYLRVLDAIWQDTVYRKMYVTGGIGSVGRTQGFGHAYDLPNVPAYCETCASVGMVLWNHRLNILTGESRYVDVLERTLYNSALAGLSLSGNRFFYTNPLAGLSSSSPVPQLYFELGRQGVFRTNCCPPNISRLMTSLGSYVYGVSARAIWVNLFAASQTEVSVGNNRVGVRMQTDYPWSGEIKLTLTPERRGRFALRLRVPGWARNVAVPGDLYQFTEGSDGEVTLRVNGQRAAHREEKGYWVVDRWWSKGDQVDFSLPMPVRTLAARTELRADRSHIALQRGPIVYCAEALDNEGNAWNLVAEGNERITEQADRIQNEPIIALRRKVTVVKPSMDGLSTNAHPGMLKAIPYYTWANRDCYEMQLWLPTRITTLKVGT